MGITALALDQCAQVGVRHDGYISWVEQRTNSMGSGTGTEVEGHEERFHANGDHHFSSSQSDMLYVCGVMMMGASRCVRCRSVHTGPGVGVADGLMIQGEV